MLGVDPHSLELMEPESPLEILKKRLDPREGAHEDIMSLMDEKFNEIIELFSQVFDENSFNGFGQKKHGIALKAIREKQLDAVWLYMAFSLYVHHWASDRRVVNGNNKLVTIKKMDTIALPCINTCIKNINDVDLKHYEKHNISYHQKILQVNGNLFAFAHNILKHQPESFSLLASQLPLTIKHGKLECSKNKDDARKKKKYKKEEQQAAEGKKSISNAENQVYYQLLNELNGVPEDFKPLKQHWDEIYIDRDSGLELDFPLRGNISIETDGIHHTLGQQGKHSLAHNIKSFLMREQGWTRVGIAVDDNLIVRAQTIGRALQHQPVEAYHAEYQKLMSFRKNLRQEIIKTQRELTKRGRSADEIKAHIEHMRILLNIDSEIGKVVQERHLEKALTQVSLQEITEIQKLLESIENNNREIEGFNEQIKGYSSQEKSLKNDHTKMQERINNLKKLADKSIEKIEQCSKEIEAINKQIDDFRKSKDDLEKLKRLSRQQKKLESEIVANEETLIHQQSQINSLQNELDTLTANLNSHSGDIEREKKKITPRQGLIERDEAKIIEFYQRWLPIQKVSECLNEQHNNFLDENKHYKNSVCQLEKEKQRSAKQKEEHHTKKEHYNKSSYSYSHDYKDKDYALKREEYDRESRDYAHKKRRSDDKHRDHHAEKRYRDTSKNYDEKGKSLDDRENERNKQKIKGKRESLPPDNKKSVNALHSFENFKVQQNESSSSRLDNKKPNSRDHSSGPNNEDSESSENRPKRG